MIGEEYTTNFDNVKDSRKSLVEQAEKDPIGTVAKLFNVTEPEVARRNLVWDRYQRKYRRGLMYLTDTSSTPLYFTNYIFSVVENAKAHIARNMPVLNAKPRGRKDDVAADIMTRVLKDELLRAGIKTVTREVTHYGLINTIGWFKIGYDDVNDSLDLMACHPNTVFIDPIATDYREARWIIHKLSNVDASKIYAEYGEYPLSKDRDEKKNVASTMSERSSLYATGDNMQSIVDVAPTVDVYECWIRDYSKERKNDWYVVTVAGDVVLKNEHSVYDHNCHPFVPWIAVEDYNSDNFYTRGVGYVEEIEPLQDKADALDLRIDKNIALTSNRQKIISAQAGVNPAVVDNTQGRVITVNGDPSRAIYYDIPPQFGSDVYGYRTNTELLIQTVSGIMDVTQGRRPTGIIAGRAIQSLKESAEVRLADTTDTAAWALSEVGALAIQIILQFFTKDRIVRATDANKDDELRVIAEYPPSLAKGSDIETLIQAREQMEAQQMAMGLMPPEQSGMGMPPNDTMGGMLPNDMTGMGAGMPMTPAMGGPSASIEDMVPEDAPPEDLETIDGVSPELRRLREEWKKRNNIALVLEDVQYEWDIFVNTDTALPTSSAERGQVAADLFRLGAIDREALLTALNYPDAEGILRRLEKDVTGKDAGNPDAEAGQDVIAMLMNSFAGILTQLGLPQEMIPMIMQELQGSLQQSQAPAPNQATGNFPPQITM